MFDRNIKQTITTLEIFAKLEDKLFTRDCSINSTYFYSDGLEITIDSPNYKLIYVKLTDKAQLCITTYGTRFPKAYNQQLTDEEYEDVKKRLIKIVQKQQDEFEQWIKSSDVDVL